MTFIYEPDPYSVEIYQMCKYELPMSELSKVIVTEIIHHTASRVVNKPSVIYQQNKLQLFNLKCFNYIPIYVKRIMPKLLLRNLTTL